MTERLGTAGELFTRKWLEQQGYQSITQNWRTKTGEIDLIVQKEGVLVFVEVKTLPHTSLEDLDIIIGTRKQQRICKTAKYFLSTYREYNKMHIRFDVVIVPFDPRKVKNAEPIHLKNVFEDYI